MKEQDEEKCKSMVHISLKASIFFKEKSEMNLASKSEGAHGRGEHSRKGQRFRTSVIRTGNRSQVRMRGTLKQH